jgi:uncharacterized protein YecE (DUF72 family)
LGKILVGISTWSDPELLKSGFYPKELKTGSERLQYYASNFPLVEMDSSYHVMPSRRNAVTWIEATPPGFIFDLKVFSLFTEHPTPSTSIPRDIREKFPSQLDIEKHIYVSSLEEKTIDALWDWFLLAISPFKLANKLGVISFQFPPWFIPKPANFEYIALCRKKLSAYRIAVEFRRDSWLDAASRPDTIKFLKEKDIILVCVNEPQGFKTSLPPLSEITSSVGIIRFHGRNSENWEKKDISPTERFAYLYSEKELEEWLPKIRSMSKNTKELHIIFKNKHMDYEVRNARQMMKLLELQ